jgi:hypothetical protein
MGIEFRFGLKRGMCPEFSVEIEPENEGGGGSEDDTEGLSTAISSIRGEEGREGIFSAEGDCIIGNPV